MSATVPGAGWRQWAEMDVDVAAAVRICAFVDLQLRQFANLPVCAAASRPLGSDRSESLCSPKQRRYRPARC